MVAYVRQIDAINMIRKRQIDAIAVAAVPCRWFLIQCLPNVVLDQPFSCTSALQVELASIIGIGNVTSNESVLELQKCWPTRRRASPVLKFLLPNCVFCTLLSNKVVISFY